MPAIFFKCYATMKVLPNIKYLHIIRGVAALLVVVFHAKFVFWVGGSIYNAQVGLHSAGDYILFSLDMLSSCGKECVVVFFILSAFVIKHSFSNHHYSWGNFYKLRFIRIYWPFLCSVIFSIVVLVICVKYINPHIYTPDFREYNTRIFNAYNELSFRQVFETVFFIDKWKFAGANFAYWSLSHELVFYILFPLYNKLNKWWMLLAAGAFFGTMFILTGYDIFYYQIFFVAGLMLYKYFFNHSNAPLIKNKAMYIVLLIIFFVADNISNKMISEQFSDFATLVYSFFIFDYILYFIKRKNKWLMKLGDISYSLYLNHLPLIMAIYTLFTLYTGKLVFYSRLPYYSAIPIVVLLVIPLYLLMEKPSIVFLKKMRKS